MDVVILARMQFAANVTFDILFHSISILSELYLPTTLMLVGLILLGADFDFKVKAKANRKVLGSPAVRGSLCWLPFALLVLIFFLSFLGLSYSIYPFVVIDRLAVWQAASSPESLRVILIGVCVTLPVIVGYTGFSCRVFRGKTIELHYA